MDEVHEFSSPFRCLSSVITASLSVSSKRRLMLPSTLPWGASLMLTRRISNWISEIYIQIASWTDMQVRKSTKQPFHFLHARRFKMHYISRGFERTQTVPLTRTVVRRRSSWRKTSWSFPFHLDHFLTYWSLNNLNSWSRTNKYFLKQSVIYTDRLYWTLILDYAFFCPQLFICRV